MRGGDPRFGDICGVFFVYLGNVFSSALWYCGAALSFKLSTHYSMRSCLSSLSYNCGSLCINMASNAAYANWTFGAALCVHIMLFVVVLQVMAPIVGCFMFVSELISLMAAGTVVLLYDKK